MATHIHVVLTEDMANLGKSGELVRVRPGFARNFLVPRGLANQEVEMPDEVTVRTAENELTLEQMSEALPDTPAIMTQVGDSWQIAPRHSVPSFWVWDHPEGDCEFAGSLRRFNSCDEEAIRLFY